jgi:hypothetical protein
VLAAACFLGNSIVSANEFTAGLETVKLFVPELSLARQELNAETRAKFEPLWAKTCESAAAYRDAWQRAFSENPTLKRAIDGLDRVEALEVEVHRDRSEVERYYKEQGENAFRAFQNWGSRWARLSSHAWFNPQEDKEFAKIVLWFSRETHEGDPKAFSKWFPYAKFVQDVLPADGTELTESRALEILQLAVRRRAADVKECAELERKLEMPRFVRDYLIKEQEVNSVGTVCDAYVRDNRPPYVGAAEERWVSNMEQCRQLWPGVQRALEHQGRQMEAAAHAPVRHVGTIVALNVAILALLAWWYFRRTRRSAGDPSAQ